MSRNIPREEIGRLTTPSLEKVISFASFGYAVIGKVIGRGHWERSLGEVISFTSFGYAVIEKVIGKVIERTIGFAVVIYISHIQTQSTVGAFPEHFRRRDEAMKRLCGSI